LVVAHEATETKDVRHIISKNKQMKTYTLKKSAFFFKTVVAIAAVVLLMNACSKERIEDRDPMNDYDAQNTNNYMNSKQEQEQEYEIDSAGSCPLTGLYGTEVCLSKTCLMKPNGDSVFFPFKIKLIELVKPKHMIFYQMSSLSGNSIMETDAAIRLRAFKDGTELSFRPGACAADVKIPNAAPKNYMGVFYGTNASSNVNWTDSNTPWNVVNSPSRYASFINPLGWFNCGKNRGSANNHTLTFASTTDNLSNVALFVYFPSIKGVMQVSNLSSNPIPHGSDVVLIAIGVNASNQLYSFTQTLNVTADAQINVTMSATTDAVLTAFLDAL
jgi:hypothetical protein